MAAFVFDVEDLMRARDYRELLSFSFEQMKQHNPKISYAGLARKAGLSARSYMREILVGERAPTTKVFPALCRALGLTGALQEYLSLLIAIEHDSFNSQQWDQKTLASKIANLRAKILKRSEKRKMRMQDPQVFKVANWPVVFASLGTTENGASLNEIVSRSGLSWKECEQALDQMRKSDLVIVKEYFEANQRRYFPQNQHAIFAKIAESQKLRDFYLNDLKKLHHKAAEDFDRADHMFFDSSFSVSRQKLPELKAALWKTLTDFVDDSERPEGDCVATLITGFFPNK